MTGPQEDWIERMTREKGRSPAGVFGPPGEHYVVATWVNTAWIVYPNGEYQTLERKQA